MEELNSHSEERCFYLFGDIFVRISGSGPGLVLFHNGFDSSQSWQALRAALGEHFTVLEYDRRGYGLSYKDSYEIQDKDMIVEGSLEFDHVLHGLATLGQEDVDLRFGPQAQFAMLGHCMGGAIAATWAQAHQSRVSHLILEATGFFSDAKIRSRTDWALQAWPELDQAARDYLTVQHGQNASAVWSQISQHRTSYVMSPNYDLRPSLAQLMVPVSILQGNRDLYFDFGHAQAAAAIITDCHLHLITGGSHDYHQQCPIEFAKLVIDFAAGSQ